MREEKQTLTGLVDDLQEEQRRHWREGDCVSAETYLARTPELLATTACALQLLYSEMMLREERGETPQLDEYVQRFPQLSDQLPLLFEVHQALESGKLLDSTAVGFSLNLTTRLNEIHPSRNEPGGSGSWPRLAGYEILAELGRGGMGVVYKARQTGLNRVIALKMIRVGNQTDPAQLARFRAEAEMLARLEHPNIVKIHEVGENEGQPYFSLEFVEGGSLAQQLNATPQPPRPAAAFLAQLARAMHAAHGSGIVHRDLKPANILLQQDKADAPGALFTLQSVIPKITDFGLAKNLHRDGGQTGSGAVLGTPSYMAPEQADGQGQQIGPAADVYALGTILYELLAGAPPFKADTQLATLRLLLTEEPLPLSRLHVPGDLVTICFKCLNKDPRKRYSTALELADDLERFLGDQPIRARPTGPLERTWRWCRRKPALATVTFLALTLLLATVAVSISFALYQLRAAHQLAGTLHDVETQRGLAEEQSRQAGILATRLAIAQGVTLCEQGDAGQGILWLARSLDLVPAGEESLRESIQRLLGGWSQELHPLKTVVQQGDAEIAAVAFSPDGKAILTGGGDYKARLWDTATGKPMGPWLQHRGPVNAVAFSPDGKVLLTGIGGLIKAACLWEAATGNLHGIPLFHSSDVLAVAFSPDGKTVLTGTRNNAAHLWDVTTRKPLGSPLPHQGAVLAVAFNPDGSIALTASEDKMARLWQVATGQLLGTPLLHQDNVRAVAFGPEGTTILTGCRDFTAQLWNTKGQPLGKPLQHTGDVTAVAFSPNGQLILTGSNDHTVQIWEAATGKRRGPRLRHANGVMAVAFSPDGQNVLTGGWDRMARCWGVTTGLPLATLPHPKTVNAVAFHPKGKSIVTGSLDTRLRLWESTTGKSLGILCRHPAAIHALAFRPDGNVILTGGSDNTARQWDAVTGEPLGPTFQHMQRVTAVAFSPDGKTVLTSSEDRTARLWDAATGQLLGSPLQHRDKVYAVGFSPDGKTVVTGSHDRTARLWNASTGDLMGTPLQHQDLVFAVAFDPSGQTILTGGWEMIGQFWNARTGSLLRAPLHHQSSVLAVAFSPDGTIVLTGSNDKTARLWDTATGHPLGLPLQHAGPVRAVAFCPEGKTIVTGCLDGTARIWPVRSPVEGDAQQLGSYVQVLTGMELDSTSMIHWLNGQSWHDRQQRLKQESRLTTP